MLVVLDENVADEKSFAKTACGLQTLSGALKTFF